MKIRCETNSVRLRLRKSEIEALRKNHFLRTEVKFPGEVLFAWELRLDPESVDMNAGFSEGTLFIRLPFAAAFQWMDSEQVGMVAPDADGLYLLVEKDFPCKDRPDEDKADYFQELADQQEPLC